MKYNIIGDEDGLVVLDQGVMCITCGKVLSSEAIGKRHVKESHRPTQKVQCRICKRFYKNERARNEHYRTAHGVTAKQMQNIIKIPGQAEMSAVFDENIEEPYY